MYQQYSEALLILCISFLIVNTACNLACMWSYKWQITFWYIILCLCIILSSCITARVAGGITIWVMLHPIMSHIIMFNKGGILQSFQPGSCWTSTRAYWVGHRHYPDRIVHYHSVCRKDSRIDWKCSVHTQCCSVLYPQTIKLSKCSDPTPRC